MTKEKLVQLLSWSLSLIALVAVISFALSLRPQRGAWGSDIQSLEERLVQLGIPVKSIKVTEPSPLEIEVIIQSSVSDEKFSQEDLWHRFLTEREVELAYLHFATHIKSYRLILVTTEGNTVYDSTVFLYPDLPSQKITQAPPSPVDNNQTKDILEENLDLKGLKYLNLDVTSGYSNDNIQLVTIDLSTETSAEKTDITQINEFIMNARPQIEEINTRYGTGIALVHILIKDSDNTLLVDYMADFETGRQYSWTAENIDGNWYPQPAPVIIAESTTTPVPVLPPTATVPKSTTLPTPTTRLGPYPPPPPTVNPYP